MSAFESNDSVGAFLSGARVRIDGRPGGQLAGLTFAAKDLFDVAGHPTRCAIALLALRPTVASPASRECLIPVRW